MTDVYYQFAMLLLSAAVVGAVAQRLHQPLIVAFIIVGVALGPSGMNWVTAHAEVGLLAQIGVTILLFVVGLRLDLGTVKNVGPVALATGLGQIAFTVVIGFGLALALGMAPLPAMYVAIALTFSSTIIIVKLLSDKRELDSLHGRIALGFLIVQDIAVVVAMLLLGASQTQGAEFNPWQVGFEVAYKLGLSLLAIGILMRYVLPRVMKLLARSQDLLLVFAVAWGTALSATGELLGFSKEIGAFLAGFSLASTHYREAIASRLSGLRDFLLLFFFIDMGSNLDVASLGDQVGSALILSLFVLIGNPLIVMVIMGYMGYRKRTSFLAGLTVAQISEFSIIFVAMGISLGHIDAPILGLVTLVGVATITLSTYMILYSQPLYAWLAPWLGRLERQQPFRELKVEQGMAELAHATDVIVFGAGRFGRRLMTRLHELGFDVLAVDFDPEIVQQLQQQKLSVRFGDAEDMEFAASLPLTEARWIVSTLPEQQVNMMLIRAMREHGFAGKVAVTSRRPEDTVVLEKIGADRVFHLYQDAADYAAGVLATNLDLRDALGKPMEQSK